MENIFTPETDWQILLRMLPSNWRELAKSTKAITRKFRNFESEESVLRTLLMHVGCGYSLRETVTRAKISNIADISDVALLKRLRCSENWFKELSLCLLKERGIEVAVNGNNNIRMKLVDGTNVKEPGKTGSLWRIHYSLILPDLRCDYFKLTSTEGNGTGESYRQFPIQKEDCIIGDRGYSTVQGVAYVASKGAYSLVRVNTASLPLFQRDQSKFDLFSEVTTVKQEYGTKEWEVMLNADDQLIIGRLCVIRKSDKSAEEALKKLRQSANKRQHKLKPETEEFAKYVILFTTLPNKKYPLD